MADVKPDLRAIFCEALNRKSAEELAQYLDAACGGDAGLRTQVEELLASHRDAGNFLGGTLPSGNVTVDMPEIAEEPGAVIGPYKLLEQIGEGGFGIVYMADQQAPVRRRVALKIIKPGMDTRQVLARFKAELQALSLMDHPNIARALDAGATDSGRPYFVMELVRGVPITEYCDQNNLAVHERLDLFVQICHAVQHAHQKGIIHRDIKPSNVLVTVNDGRPVPKVIDFGVAKAINQQLTPETLFTRFAEMIGTPLYMSPEQAEMTSLDIDTRADIYSLGVLLYELLTGSTPFDKDRLRKAGHDEICRIIREEEPPKPSLRISTLGATRTAVAAHRHVDPHHLGQLVRGDLDWIVMKALEKDRTRRYETANGLAMDLQRHLADEPVLAGPPSAAYRFRKFARRNRAALAMTAVITFALLLGIVGTTWQAIQATRERNRAVIAEGLAQTRSEAESHARAAEADQRREAQTQHAQAEANFHKARAAVDESFTLVSESKLLDVPSLQPLRKQLLEAALRYYQGFSRQKSDDPQMLAELALSYLRVSVIDNVIDRNDDAFAALEQGLAVVERLRRQYPTATEQHRLLAGYWKGLRQTKISTELPREPLKAALLLEKFAEHWESFVRENPTITGFQSDLVGLYGQRAALLGSLGRRADALSFMQKARPIGERLVRENPTVPEYRAGLATTYQFLADALRAAGRSKEADELLPQILALREQAATDPASAPQHRLDFARNLQFLGNRLWQRGDVPQAEKTLRRVMEIFQKLVDESRDVPLHLQRLAGAQVDLAKLLKATGRLEEAEKLMRQALDLRTRLVVEFAQKDSGGYASDFSLIVTELANLLQDSGRVQEAKKVRKAGIETLNKQVGAKNSEQSGPNWERFMASNYGQLAKLLDNSGQPQEAEKAVRKGVEIAANDASAQHEFGRFLHGRGRLAEAEACFRREIAINPRKDWAHHELGWVLRDRGRLEEAEACFRKEIELYPRREWSHHELGRIHYARGQMAEAEACFRKAIDIDPRHFWSYFILGDMLFAAGKVDDAVACYRKVVEINPQEEWAQRKCGQFLLDHGRLDEAEAYFHKAIDLDPKNTALYHDLARGLQAHGRLDAAESCLRKVIASHPKDLALQDALGELLVARKRYGDAIDVFRHQLDLAKKRALEFPGRPENVTEIGRAAISAIRGTSKVPQKGESNSIRQDVATTFTNLQRSDAVISGPPKQRLIFAQAFHNLAGAFQQAKEFTLAGSAYRQSIEMYGKLAAELPKNLDYQLQLSFCHNELATSLRAAGRPAEAEQGYRQALAIKEKLAAESPENPDFRFHLAHGHLGLAYLLTTTKQQEAEKHYRQAVELFEKAAAHSLAKDYYRADLGHTLWQLGDFLSAAKRPGEAEPTYRKASAVFEKLAVDFPENKFWMVEQGFSHWKFGDLMKELGRLPHAEESYRKALTIYGKLSAEVPNDAEYQSRLARSHVLLIDVLLLQHKHVEAAKLAVALSHLAPENSETLHAAVYLEQCAAVAKLDTSLMPADLKTVNDAYSKQSAEFRSEAGKRGAGNGVRENQLAWALVTNPKPELRSPARAVELARKAVELAPQAGYIWNTLGIAQYRAGDWKAAEATLRKSMELRKGGDSTDWFFVGMCLWQQGDKLRARTWYEAGAYWMAKRSPDSESLKRFRGEASTLMGLPETGPVDNADELALGEVMVEAYPKASSYRQRGEAFANSEQWIGAADDFAKAIELGEKTYSAWYERALVQRAKNDKPGYQAACADMLKRFAKTDDGLTANFVAWSCALGPDALTDFAPAIALAAKATKIDAKSAQFANSLGAILYRAGRFEEARQKLEEAERLASPTDPRRSPSAYRWFFLAMTHHHLKHANEAKKWLDKAREETDKPLKGHDAGTAQLPWNRRLTLSLLRRETEELIGFKQPPAPETKKNKPTK